MLWFKLFYLWFEFYFPLFQTHYHTLSYPKQWKIKFKPRIELKVYPELIKVHTANIQRSDHVLSGFLQEVENNGKS